MQQIHAIPDNFEKARKLLDGKIDICVNNAGIYMSKDFLEYHENDWNSIIDTNLKSVFFLTQEVCKYFLEHNINGNILFISSEMAIAGDSNIYGISKAGLNNMIGGLCRAYAGNQIRFNGIAPGAAATGITNLNPEGNLYAENIIGNRYIRPEEIAEVACFLVSDAAKCINGEIITCNNGNIISNNR